MTIHSAHRLFLRPRDFSHEVWLFHMVDSGLCHGLTHFAISQIIYLKPELQSAKHLVSLDAYKLFIAATITEAFSEFTKFEYFQLLITSILAKIIYFMQSSSYFKLQGTVTSFMQLNERFRYSLLHKRIICTTLPFHRAFSVANRSWLPSSCTYYPAFIIALEMVPELSSFHHFSH